MDTVLFVCTGNASRSPMAKACLERYLREHRLGGVRLVSAGTRAESGRPANPESIRVCRQAGLDLSGHIRRDLTETDLSEPSCFVVMEEAHRQELLSLCVPEDRILMAGKGVDDPYLEGGDAYERCLEEILSLTPQIFRDLKERGICFRKLEEAGQDSV